MATIPTPAQVQYQQDRIEENRVGNLIAANAACLGFAFIFVGLRFVARWMRKIRCEADDWLVVAGLIWTCGFTVAATVCIVYGAGRHSILYDSPEERKRFGQGIIAGEVIYNPAIFCIKASILYLYHRIFSTSAIFRKTLWVVGIFVFSYSSIQALGSTIQCFPLRADWEPLQHHWCMNLDVAGTILGTCNVLTDFIILALPIHPLWQLQRPFKEKLEIMGMFLLGGFVCFASIYRAIVVHQLSHFDPCWSDDPVIWWTMIELSTAIISACLPTMRPILSRLGIVRVIPVRWVSKLTSISSGGDTIRAECAAERPDPSPHLQRVRSIPSQSAAFAHLGVLGNLDLLEAQMKSDTQLNEKT